MKKKVTSLRALHKSHVEEMQNVVRLHKANSDASLEEISSLSASNRHSIEEVSFVSVMSIALIFCLGLTSIFC